MKKLEEIAFDFALCRKQFEEFRDLLAPGTDLSERDDVLPFFRARPHLAVLFSMFNPRIAWADRIAWEFDIFGDFACDLVVGEWARGEYCFIEFEDARAESVFERQGKKATREWARRFDHGYSQIIDWAHKLDGRAFSVDCLARFGRPEINYETAFFIGRDAHLDEGEKHRLSWRSDRVAVNNKKVTCLTFDGLLSQFSVRLTMLSRVEATAGAAKGSASPPDSPPEPTA